MIFFSRFSESYVQLFSYLFRTQKKVCSPGDQIRLFISVHINTNIVLQLLSFWVRILKIYSYITPSFRLRKSLFCPFKVLHQYALCFMSRQFFSIFDISRFYIGKLHGHQTTFSVYVLCFKALRILHQLEVFKIPSVLQIRIQIGFVFRTFVDPDPDRYSEYGSGPRQVNILQDKLEAKIEILAKMSAISRNPKL